MTIVAIIDPRSPLGEQFRWALRIAEARRVPLCFAVRGLRQGEARTVRADATTSDADVHDILSQLRIAVDSAPSFRLDGDPPDDAADPGDEGSGADARLTADLIVVHGTDQTAGILRAAGERSAVVILVTFGDDALLDPDAIELGRGLVQRAPCSVVLLRVPPDARPGDTAILAPAVRGDRTIAALRMAREIAQSCGAPLRPIFVEPPIGPDAELVGRRAAEGVLAKVFGKDREGIDPLIVIERDVARGIARGQESVNAQLVVLGA